MKTTWTLMALCIALTGFAHPATAADEGSKSEPKRMAAYKSFTENTKPRTIFNTSAVRTKMTEVLGNKQKTFFAASTEFKLPKIENHRMMIAGEPTGQDKNESFLWINLVNGETVACVLEDGTLTVYGKAVKGIADVPLEVKDYIDDLNKRRGNNPPVRFAGPEIATERGH